MVAAAVMVVGGGGGGRGIEGFKIDSCWQRQLHTRTALHKERKLEFEVFGCVCSAMCREQSMARQRVQMAHSKCCNTEGTE